MNDETTIRLGEEGHLETVYGVRPAEVSDLAEIAEIYAHFVRRSVATFDETARSLDEWREKFDALAAVDLPFLVAHSPRDGVLGYALLQPWSAKSAYRFTTENSIYLAPGTEGQGIGRALLTALLTAGSQAGVRQVVAVIVEGGDASIALHRKLGFTEVGHLAKVGRKFDRWLGIVQLQLELPRPEQPLPPDHYRY